MRQVLNVGRRLRDRLAARTDYPQVIELKDVASTVLRFRVYSPVESFRVAEFGGERAALTYFLSVLKPTDVVFDIGASVGLFSVSAASLLTSGKVYAFEPDPDTRARLEENLQLNGAGNAGVIPWAVGSGKGEVALYSDGAKGFAPSLVRQERAGAPTTPVHVPVRALDSALADGELPVPDVLKVDIEGAEALWLQGSLRLLRGEFGKRPRIVFLELHPEFLPLFNSSAEAIKGQLAACGYRVEWEQLRERQVHLCYGLDQ